jgi:hypothetical protein
MKKGAMAPSNGWFRAMRSNDALELIRTNPFAYVLAAVIAHRGRYHESFNQHNLELGEAFLGDFEAYGMTEQNYRTAKAQLSKWGFATFKPTSKGTVARLADTRLFSIFRLEANYQNNERVSDGQRTCNGRVTTNKDQKNGRAIRTEESSSKKHRDQEGSPASNKRKRIQIPSHMLPGADNGGWSKSWEEGQERSQRRQAQKAAFIRDLEGYAREQGCTNVESIVPAFVALNDKNGWQKIGSVEKAFDGYLRKMDC